jgi:peptidoglycan lytic transglycosylase
VKRIALCLLLLGGCASTPEPRPGGFYKDDGLGEAPPPNLADIRDAEPKVEPLHRYANRPYQVFGRDYVPLVSLQPFRQRGLASWYGKRFHGQRTASGEAYDMYGMTAAHTTLPIPSYARVTHLGNGRSVVVRINDRGPFHPGRAIDLSYAAAARLGFVQAGSAEVEVEAIVPGDAVYVQLGAFSSRENAESLRTRVARELADLTDILQVLISGNLWRLHVGPYRTQDDARSVAERIESQLDLKPLLVVR